MKWGCQEIMDFRSSSETTFMPSFLCFIQFGTGRLSGQYIGCVFAYRPGYAAGMGLDELGSFFS